MRGKKYIAIVLSILLAVTGCMVDSLFAESGEITLETTDYYYLDLGMQPVERTSSNAKWTNGIAWGETVYGITYTLDLPYRGEGVYELVSVDAFSEGLYPFDENSYTNLPEEKALDERAFVSNYGRFISLSIDNVEGVFNGGRSVTFSYDVLMDNLSEYEVCKKTSDTSAAEVRSNIYDLLCGEAAFAADQPAMYASVEAAIENRNTPGRLLYVVFMPTVFHYRVTREVPVVNPEVPEPVVPTGPAIDGDAHLGLPDHTFEGHTVLAEDKSIFWIDNREYSAYRAYMEGYGKDSFAAGDSLANMRRVDKTSMDITFGTVGTFPVNLTAIMSSGDRYRDSKSIEVLKTPSIGSYLSGIQKQNRRQVITADIAVNPKYPIVDWYLSIRDKGSGETVTLSAVNLQTTAGSIKTRPIKFTTDINGCYSHISIEFLTKTPNSGVSDFSYEVYAVDTRGNEDRVTRDFTVKADEPPDAKIGAENAYLRNQGSDLAEIKVSDFSTTDGDSLERRWYCTLLDPLTGVASAKKEIRDYEDKSFGSGQTISFEKQGVGELIIELRVKDRWTEATLPEFIAEEDYLESRAIAETRVLDVAPMVSIKPIDYIKASIYMLTRDEEEYGQLQRLKEDLRGELLANGIIPEITLDYMSVEPLEEWSQEDQVRGERTLFNIEDQYGSIVGFDLYGSTEGNGATETNYFQYADKDHLYVLQGTWKLYEHYNRGSYPEYWNYQITMPYHFTGYDIYSREKLWELTVTEDMLSVSNSSSNHFTSDITNRYLFFKGDSKTMIMNRDTGAVLGYIPDALGDDIFCSEDTIYYLKEDGLYAVSGSLNVSKIYDGPVALHDSWSDVGGAAKLINREITFVTLQGGNLIKCGYNIDSNELHLSQLVCEERIPLNLNVIAMSDRGELVLGRTYIGSVTVSTGTGGAENRVFIDKSTYKEAQEVLVFDEKGNLKRVFPNLPAGRGTQAAWNQSGSFEYLAVVTNTYSGGTISGTSHSYDNTGCYLYEIESGNLIASYTDSNYVKNGNGTYGYTIQADKVIYAHQSGTQVLLHAGGWIGTSDHGLTLSFLGEKEPNSFVVFDIEKGTASYQHSNTVGTSGSVKLIGSSTEVIPQLYGGFTTPYYVGGNMMSSYATSELYLRGKWGYINQKPLTLEDLYSGFLLRETADVKDGSSVVLLDSSPGGAHILEELSNVKLIRNIVPEGIIEKLKSFFKEGRREERVVKVEARDQEAYIEKEYKLKPGTKYYFEVEPYGFEELEVEALTKLESGALDSALTGRQYRVCQDHFEDFSDYSRKDPFFTTKSFSKGYYIAIARYSTGRINSFLSGAIEFTVPEGKVATLSVDTLAVSNDENAARIEIRNELGQTLDYGVLTTRTGHFESNILIPEGRNKLIFLLAADGNPNKIWDTWYWYIDNLHVQILEEMPPATQEEKGEWVQALTTAGNRGDFITPASGTTIYREQKSEYFDVEPVSYEDIEALTFDSSGSYSVAAEGYYDLDLYGPSSDSRGGYLRAKLYLREGDRVDFFLGEGVEGGTELRDGSSGKSGGGYDDVKGLTYEELLTATGPATALAAVYVNGELAMVAGGGGAKGNPGVGTGGLISTIRYSIVTHFTTGRNNIVNACPYCGLTVPAQNSGYQHTANLYSNSGGAGGSGGVGGGRTLTLGNNGGAPTPANGSCTHSAEIRGSGNAKIWASCNYYKTSGAGNGGRGGSGGASYLNDALAQEVIWTAGGSAGASSMELKKLPLVTTNETISHSSSIDYIHSYRYEFNVPEGKYSAFVEGDVDLAMSWLDYNSRKGWIAISHPVSVTLDSSMASDGVFSTGYQFYDDFKMYSKEILGRRNFFGRKDETMNYSSGGNRMNSAQAVFNRFRGVIVSEVTPALTSGKYYFGDVDYDGKGELIIGDVESDDGGFAGTLKVTLRIKLPPGTSYIKDYRLFTMNGDKKIYLDEKLNRPSGIKDWQTHDATLSLVTMEEELSEDEVETLVYRKGEYVDYKVYYSDYEEDPQKSGYFIYGHIPFNDGENPDAAIILNEDEEVIKIKGQTVTPGAYSLSEAAELVSGCPPIHRFYVDGKYIALYYAYDDTSRGKSAGGYPDFDKRSNFAELPFYIIGDSLTAPYITHIRTDPATPAEGGGVQVLTGIDDKEKDELSLTVEAYRDRERILREKWTGLKADSFGNYPESVTSSFLGEEGVYQVVATVRDATGIGVGSYRFVILSEGSIKGKVSHTEQWERNRLGFNAANPAKTRGPELFWAGEKFMLSGAVLGQPKSVAVKIENLSRPGRSLDVLLSDSGNRTGANEAVYTGAFYDKETLKWGARAPEEVQFTFIATYSGGRTKEDVVVVLVDNRRPYTLLHRIK